MTKKCKHGNQQGLSLIELLIAMALLSAIALGVLPLFMRSIADRNRGWEATQVSGFAQAELEPLLAADLADDSLTLVTTATEKITNRVWTEGSDTETGDALEGWVDSASSTGRGRITWNRDTFVRWYNLNDLGTPLDGNTEVTSVHLKEIQVHVTGEREGGGLGAGQDLWIRVLKAY